MNDLMALPTIESCENLFDARNQTARDHGPEIVDMDPSEKLTSSEPTVQLEAYLELVHKNRGDVFLRLPFSKECPADMYDYQWVRHLATMLQKTLESERWFHNGRLLDLERGTRLGTLGYLPAEIRNQIWREVAGIAGPEWWDPLRTDGARYFSHHFLGKNNFIFNIWEALGPCAREFDAAFFPMCKVIFATPANLQTFLSHFNAVPSPALHLEVRILEDQCRGCSAVYWCECEFDDMDGKLLSMLGSLPPSVNSISFELGCRAVIHWDNPIEPLLEHFRLLNEAVLRRSPEAERSVQLKDIYQPVSIGDFQAFEAVMKEAKID